jgi:hypothetical protein
MSIIQLKNSKVRSETPPSTSPLLLVCVIELSLNKESFASLFRIKEAMKAPACGGGIDSKVELLLM